MEDLVGNVAVEDHLGLQTFVQRLDVLQDMAKGGLGKEEIKEIIAEVESDRGAKGGC